MIREYLSIFYTSYIYSNVFLLPLYVLYLFIDHKRIPQSLTGKVQKSVIILTLCIPLFLSLVALAPSGINPYTIGVSGASEYQKTEGEVRNPASQKAISEMADLRVTINHYQQTTQFLLFYVIDLIALLSLSGLLIFFVRFFYQTFYIKRIERNTEKIEAYCGCHLIHSKEINSPFSLGFRKKRIFLPETINETERKVILKHEINHFIKNHHIWSLLESFIVHLFWFNPISHLIGRRGRLFREMECDADTLQTTDQYAYSRILVNTAIATTSRRPGLSAHGWIQSGNLKKRLDRILNRKNGKNRLYVTLAFYLALILSVSVFLFSGPFRNNDYKEDLMTKVTNQYHTICTSRETIALNDIPEHLIKTVIIKEDNRFYKHKGISIPHILKAAANNISGGPLLGASTITQQLIKSLGIVGPERSLKRKIQEIKAARVLEEYYSKDNILEMYLNTVYFGKGAWGLGEASRTFFKHPVSELTIAESAMLVQCLTRPREYNYQSNPEMARKRQEQLLLQAVNRGVFSKEKAEKSLDQFAVN